MSASTFPRRRVTPLRSGTDQGGSPPHKTLPRLRRILLLSAALLPEVLERAGGVVPGQRRGTLYTWSVIYKNDQPPFRDRLPYVAAVVDLVEGPRMMTNVVDCPFDELQVGMALQVRFQPISDEFTIPVFVRA